MNKKGFTLPELLITISILGAIVLMIMPNITGLLEKVDKEKYNRFLSDVFLATEAYIQANIEEYPEISEENAKVYIYFNQLINSHYLKSDVYDPKNKKTVDREDFTVEAYLDDGEYNYKLIEEHYVAESRVIVAQEGETYKGIVYLDPTNLSTTCNASNSVSTPGTKTGCMKWYVFDDSGDNYTMILDHNTTAYVAWVSQADYNDDTNYGTNGNNNKGPITANKQLTTDTTGWASGLNPRLITANEVAAITGNTGWDSATAPYSQWFYLDSNNQTQTATTQGASSYAWLFDYTGDCTSNGCNTEDSSTYGYWTSSPVSDYLYRAWDVNHNGGLSYYGVSSDHYGVRPVITVSKSLLN